MRTYISLAAVLVATPALAAEDRFGVMIFIPPMNEVAFVEKGTLSATPFLDIKFDLANVGGIESAHQPQIDGKDEESTKESTSPLSGGGTVVSKYVFSDLFVQTDSPTAQVWVSLDTKIFGIDGCSLDLFAAHGFTTKIGREVDVGGSCRFDLTKGVKIELSASRYILGGAPDITTLVAKVSHGPVDGSVTQYLVDGSEPDATKVEFGYTIEPVKQLSLRGVLAYEKGFGLPDIYVGGVEASYGLNDHWSLRLSGYAPIHRSAGDPRSSEVAVGVQFNF